MEKVISQMPNSKDIKATRILEINPKHKLFEAIENLYNDNDPMLETYAKLLYDQALLIEGIAIKDPVAFSNMMCELMVKQSLNIKNIIKFKFKSFKLDFLFNF